MPTAISTQLATLKELDQLSITITTRTKTTFKAPTFVGANPITTETEENAFVSIEK